MSNRREMSVAGPRLLAGVMCGTAGDGVSVALVETSGSGGARTIEVVAHEVVDYPAEIRERLFALFPPHTFSAEELAALHRDVGVLLADAILGVLRNAGRSPDELAAAALQAPTLIHVPPAEGRLGVHLEVGEPAIVSERTGVPVVCELRPSDIAAGGHGAPLSAYVDFLLFASPERGRAIQNVGGIANVTYVPPSARPEDVVALDTGPGNMVVDGIVRAVSDGAESFDRDGRRAARGSVHAGLLSELMEHPYLARGLPKTTGREDFGDPFVGFVVERAGLLGVGGDDLVATATAYTAECIALHYERELRPRGPVDEAILYGGGRRNPTMVEMIRERIAPVELRFHDEFGIPSDAREAVTWAVLGDETLAGRAGTLPAASGADHPVVLGRIVSVHEGRGAWRVS